jgi:hypothetical protein
MATLDHLVELRGEIDREVMDVIDAVVQSRPGSHRMTLVREILNEWCEREIHRSTLVLRVSDAQRKRTGNAPETHRKAGGN